MQTLIWFVIWFDDQWTITSFLVGTCPGYTMSHDARRFDIGQIPDFHGLTHEKYLSGLSIINIFMKMDITWYNYIVFFTIMDIYIYSTGFNKPISYMVSYIAYNNSTMVSIVYNFWIFMKSIIPKLNRSVFPDKNSWIASPPGKAFQEEAKPKAEAVCMLTFFAHAPECWSESANICMYSRYISYIKLDFIRWI